MKNFNYIDYLEYMYEPNGRRRIDFFVNKIQEWFYSNEKISVIDVGCGKGTIAAILSKRNLNTLGIDIDKSSIDYAKKHYGNDTCIYRREDIFSISNQCFDVTICSEVLEHLSNPKDFIYELSRITKKGGLIFITIPNGFCLEEIIRNLAINTKFGKSLRIRFKNILNRNEHIQSKNIDCPHIQFFTLNRIEKIFKKNNLILISKKNSGAFFRQLFYLGGRFLIPRRSLFFKVLDNIDNFTAKFIPFKISSGWFFCLSKK